MEETNLRYIVLTKEEIQILKEWWVDRDATEGTTKKEHRIIVKLNNAASLYLKE